MSLGRLRILGDDSPLVTVIIPVYNKRDFVTQTLNSVISQTYLNIELVVVDDGSTDGSAQVIENFCALHANRFTRIDIIKQPNLGQSSARNAGLYRALGSYIALLDADDVWHPQKISKQVAFLELNPGIELVLCNYLLYRPSLLRSALVSFKNPNNKIDLWLATIGYGGAVESTGVFRRERLLKLGGFTAAINMSGGLDITLRLSKYSKVGNINQYLCGYRLTSTGWHTNKEDLVQSVDMILGSGRKFKIITSDLKKYSSIHISFWNLRKHFNLKNIRYFFFLFFNNPKPVSKYITLSGLRWLNAKTRLIARCNVHRFFKKIM